ncbi:MAG: type VI secretion system tip protein VgrG [Gammaproteobacteria bacterium]|nr:type VI secretion system tip protein VgrG [Gammaproteobacteria bacterium]
MAIRLEQENRLLSIATPLGDDVLILQSFAASDAVSTLFSYDCELLSAEEGIKPADIVGKRVTVSLRLAEGGERYFDGFVKRFVGSGMHTRELRRYRAEIVPWLWFLTRTSDCRIFQFKSVPDIIEEVFQDFDFTDFEFNLQGNHPQREYCVQYRESAFAFVSRLLEEEGIFYWFRHEDGKHTLVMADHKSAYVDCPENSIDYLPGSMIADHIAEWEHRYEFRSGKYAYTDYNFKTPSTSLLANTNTLVKLPDVDKFELYDYPGEYTVKSDGEDLVKWRMEEEEVPYDMVRCVSGCRTLHALGKFTVARHECQSEENKSYVIAEIQHSATDHTHLATGGESFYQNSFVCIPDSVVFRPERTTTKPLIRGPQTAVVVGPAGEEIYPDEYGRVKVQFHWDRYGNRDENSSCWTRVSQIHAGNAFGAMHIPRIGEEVIVEFLEGDPDQPIITGRVYNAEAMPPYGLPDSKTISGMKSNSTLGGGGYNEYVFDDTKGNELIREHGQFDKDSTIENDLREHVLHDRSRDVSNNETVQVGADRSKTIGKNETTNVGVNRTETVGANENITIGANRTETVGANETITVAVTRTRNVGVNEMVNVGAAQEVSVGGLQAISVGATRALTVGLSQDTSIGSNHGESIGKDYTLDVGKKRSVTIGDDDTLKVGKDLVINAGDSITIKTGKASITMKKDGTISIQGKDITVKGSGKVNVKASSSIVVKGSKVSID